MIGRLRGEVIDRAVGTAVVDVHGVGYRVAIPEGSTLRLGQPVDLHVYTHVREDALQLFAFEAALHWPDFYVHRCLVVVVANALQLVATGEGAAENCRVEQRIPHNR